MVLHHPSSSFNIWSCGFVAARIRTVPNSTSIFPDAGNMDYHTFVLGNMTWVMVRSRQIAAAQACNAIGQLQKGHGFDPMPFSSNDISRQRSSAHSSYR